MWRIRQFTDLIAGSDALFSFEHRIFNLISFFIFLFTIIGGTCNYIIGLHPMTIYLSILGCVVSGILFYLARIKNIFTGFSIAIYTLGTMLCLGGMFFFNSGTNGTVIYLIIMLLNVLLIIVKPRSSNYYWVCAVLYLTILADLLLEYFFPSWIVPYHSVMEKLLDHSTTLVYSMLTTMVVIIAFRRSYEREREKVMQQNNELKVLNEQIALQKEELMAQSAALEQTYQSVVQRNEYIQTLLKELNHRVKNNLQVVSSLLSLQGSKLEDETAKRIVLECKNRLVSLLLVHQRLYGDDHATGVPMNEYLPELVETIMYSLYGELRDNMLDYHVEPVSLHVEKAIPLGLIANELVTNSFKHAFAQVAEPALVVTFVRQGDRYLFGIADNGCGMPADMRTGEHTFGLQLVASLVTQLGGDMVVDTGAGTRITISFVDSGLKM